jgi:hypothetical protein
MNAVLPTVKILNEKGESVIINLSDYDAKVHKLALDVMTPLKPLEPALVKELFGSSIQPASWNLPDGSILQLADVVTEAHKRSGATVEGWNGLPQNEREKAIANVVEELVPLESGLSVKKKRIKGVFMFTVVDKNGKDVSEAFESEEDALDHIKVIEGR